MTHLQLDDLTHHAPEPWLRVIELAWEAHINGNIGVGAVLTDPQGQVVAEGRNRVCDEHAPDGRLHSTFLAHAEIDVLGQVKPGTYRDHVIWSSLEPCALCSTAIVMSNVGNVRYAAGDVLWKNIAKISEVNSFMANRWPSRIQSLHGSASVFCEMLPVLWFLRNKPDGTVIRTYATEKPDLLELVRRIDEDDRFRLSSTARVKTVIADIWDDLEMLWERHSNLEQPS